MAVITGFNSVEITEYTEDKKFNLSGVSSLSVSNYGGDDLFVIIANVRRMVPKFDPAINTPYTFNIEGDGTLSNITIAIEFDSITKTGKAILDYRKSETCLTN